MLDLDALISEARSAFDESEPVTQDVLLGDKAVGVRVWPLDGGEWRDLIAAHPPRPGAAQDAQAGYNVDSVVAVYPRVALVDGDDVDDMMRVVDGKAVSRWPDVCATLYGSDRRNLAAAVWGINEYTPAEALAAAGKA